VASCEDIDKTMRDGLGWRWSFMGPFETIDLNAPGGVADYAARLGPAPARESYLSIERLLEAAKQTRADLIHPGYGFLAESAPFARACREAGLLFVGPSPEVTEHGSEDGEPPAHERSWRPGRARMLMPAAAEEFRELARRSGRPASPPACLRQW
jgi:3-hydroxyacyl-CoA dehydrogenase